MRAPFDRNCHFCERTGLRKNSIVSNLESGPPVFYTQFILVYTLYTNPTYCIQHVTNYTSYNCSVYSNLYYNYNYNYNCNYNHNYCNSPDHGSQYFLPASPDVSAHHLRASEYRVCFHIVGICSDHIYNFEPSRQSQRCFTSLLPINVNVLFKPIHPPQLILFVYYEKSILYKSEKLQQDFSELSSVAQIFTYLFNL